MNRTEQNPFLPKWHKELAIFNKIKPLIILEGNILDKYVYPENTDYRDQGEILDLNSYLYAFYKNLGYQHVVFFNHIKGFYNEDCDDVDCMQNFASLIGEELHNNRIQALFSGRGAKAPDIVNTALVQNKESTIIIMDFVSRYIVGPNNMQPDDVLSFTKLQVAVQDSRDVSVDDSTRLKNSLVLLVNKINDLPAWLFHNNPLAKTINIIPPGKEERLSFLETQFQSFFSSEIYQTDIQSYSSDEGKEELSKIKQKFVGLTEGFSYTALYGLLVLCRNQNFRIHELSKVVDLYRYGVSENPWQSLEYDDIKNAEDEFKQRVKGQDFALTKTLDVIKRAMTGMDGLQHSSHTKPKGVLFFAGPTGTGKTETAKTLAQKIFGDESRCIRFDMSEFSQSHSDQRLLGAPPGYVGYEAGGQLTNAIKNNPFSILLFDEIEKAHPSIMDKFLQILEDGRMTDGQGNTVYFSECVIIFTSNLGIYVNDGENGRKQNVSPENSYAEVRKKVREGIENYFKFNLNRPEILNRIGENIVVFDFIRPDVAKEILNSQIRKIADNLKRNKNIELIITESAREQLEKLSLANLDNGGRGIGNVVENFLINPLSRYLFDNKILGDACVSVKTVVNDINFESIAETIPVIDCTYTKI